MRLEATSGKNQGSGPSSVDQRTMKVIRDGAVEADYEVIEPTQADWQKRKTELMKMGRQDLQKAAEILPPNERLAQKNDLVKRIMEAEMKSSGRSAQGEVENSEPQVTDEAERNLEEAALRERIKANFPEADSPKPVGVPIERKRVVSGGELVSKDSAYYYNRRGKGDFVPPEAEPVARPKPVAAKPDVAPIVLPERPRLLHKDELGGRGKEVVDEAGQVELIAQKLFRSEDLTGKEETFKDNHPEIYKRLRELHSGDYEKGLERPKEVPVAKVAEPRSERVLGENLPVAVKETVEKKEVTLNGNVEFQLGKLGIIDSSDPQKFEENKKAAIDKITKEIPNFFGLSPEQQLYTLKQLEKRARRNITNDAESEVRTANAANKKGGFIGRAWRKLYEGSDAVKLEKTKAAELKQKGFDGYKDDFAQLTNFVETWGVKVKEGRNGEPTLQFLEGKGKNTKHQQLIDTFNSRASAFSNIPQNWTVEHATSYQKKRAEFAKKMYERSQKALLAYESKSKQFKKEEKAARSLEITNVTSDVEMAQFLADNPGVESAVNKFIKEHPVLTKAAFVALGAGARGIAKYGAAFGGGLVASSVLGGFTSWVRKRDEFREIEAQKRAGKDVGKVAGVKEGVDVMGYTKKINQLIEKANDTKDPKRKARILQTLQTRINILKDRTQNLGVVSFGSRSEDLNNQSEYFKAIKEANRLLIPASGIDKKVSDQVYKVFDQKYLKDDQKDSERREAIRNAFTKGALISGTGFVGGFIASDYLFHDGVTTENAWAKMNEAAKAFSEGANPDNVMDAPEAIRSINPTSTVGQTVNFPENMPRPSSLPYDSTEMVSLSQTPIAESDFGARGAIGAIKDLQRALINQYGGNMPENLKEFVDANPDRLAIKWNMFRPGDMNESIALPKGTKFLALPDGNIALKFPDGKLLGVTNVTEHMQFDYFDSGARSAAPTIPNTPANPDMANQTFVSAPENNLSGVDSPQGLTGAPENLGAGTGAEAGGKFDFERVKTGLENLGFRHEAVDGGDIFSAEVPTGEDAGPQTVEGYADIDGLKVDTKELKGTIDFLYDSKGQIKSIDLPALQVEDVSRFRANPENFIGGSHDVAERAMLGKKLMTMNSQVETFLKYRRIMEVQSLHPDSPEYRFLHEESNKLWSAIQKKVEYQFNPDYNGFRPNPIENTAPQVEVPDRVAAPIDNSPVPNSGERPPFVRNLGETSSVETPAASPETGATSEIIRTNRDVIPADSILLQESFASTYGGVERVDGNVVFFKDGHVGFYAESMKQGFAERSARTLASANAENLGIDINHPLKPAATQMPGGPVRYLAIYEKVK